MNNTAMNKDNWVALFRDIGLDDTSMHKWHYLFEQRHPQAHQSFLQWLGLDDTAIHQIRRQ